MDINGQEDSRLPTTSFVEVAEDGSQIARADEAVRPSQPISKMLQSTSDTLITSSNMGNIVKLSPKVMRKPQTTPKLKIILKFRLTMS